MQAIISDIIVSQAAQNSGLQISQTQNNSSSNNVSFADMLASFNKPVEQKPEESAVAKPEPIKPQENVQSKPVEQPSDSDKSEKIKDEKLTEPQEDKAVVKKQSGETEQIKKAPVKNGEKTESDVKKNPQIKTDTDKNNQVQQKTKATDGKKVLSEEEKKALIDQQNLQILKEQSAQAQQEEAANLAAMTQNAAGVKEIDAGTAKLDNDFNPEDLSVAVKADIKTDNDFEAANIKEKISVVDLRTKPETAQDSKPVEKTAKNLKVEFNSDSTATVTMELEQQMQAAGENILSLDNQTAASTGSDFQAMVSNQIQANASDFVRAGSILLKDNDKGTINLVLHPDDLGNVKIHLSMDGKTISAHITVNTKEALEVFKDNAQTLREAFAKNGFDTASFDVSYNGNSNGGNQSFDQMYDGSKFMARNAYGELLGGGSDDGYIQDNFEKSKNSEYLINIVA